MAVIFITGVLHDRDPHDRVPHGRDPLLQGSLLIDPGADLYIIFK